MKKWSFARRLITFLLLPTVLAIVLCGVLSIFLARTSVNELHDKSLADGSEVLLSFLLYEYREYSGEDEDEDEDEDKDKDHENESHSAEELSDELLEVVGELRKRYSLQTNYRVIVRGKVLFSTADVSSLAACSPGYSSIYETNSAANTVTDVEGGWRCYQRAETVSDNGDKIIVEIFGRIADRKKQISNLLTATFLPLMLLPLVVGGVIFWAVRDSVKRIEGFSRSVEQRSIDNLEPIQAAKHPTEFLPITNSVNSFIKNIRQGIEREKRFSDDAAHELRTPITSISMVEQLLRRDNKDQRIDGLIDQLKTSIDHCQQLINQLLLFARLQSTSLLATEPVVVSSVLQAELGKLSAPIQKKGLSFEIDQSLDNHKVVANPEAFSLLLQNLLANAVKFSPENGVIRIFRTASGFCFEDDGPGIAPEHRTRIFDRFFRAPTAKAFEGSGLGLSIARWLAEAQQFSLTADEPLKGRGASIHLQHAANLS